MVLSADDLNLIEHWTLSAIIPKLASWCALLRQVSNAVDNHDNLATNYLAFIKLAVFEFGYALMGIDQTRPIRSSFCH
jgi:hypothetical protein